MLSLTFRRVLAPVLLLVIWICVAPSSLVCQCVLPNYEVTESTTGSTPGELLGYFDQTISNTAHPDVSYSGDRVMEYAGSAGTNSCYYKNGPTTQPPTVAWSTTPWAVGSSDRWGPDGIGLSTAQAQDIYTAEEEGVIKVTGDPAGCDVTSYQDMEIELRGTGSYQTYEKNVIQDRYVYISGTMRACRETSVSAACSNVNIPAP